MRVVTLEEHFTLRSLSAQVSPDAIVAKGWFSADNPFGPAEPGEKFDDVGEGRIAAMDQAGVQVQVLSYEGPGAELMPPEDSLRFARTANDTLAGFISAHLDRFAGFAHLPWTQPDACPDELERCVKELGFVGLLVNGSTDGRFLDDATYEPLLARAEALGVPIYVHPASPPRPVREAYYEALPKELAYLFSIAGWGWHVDTAVHILRLVLTGALDRHPKLTLVTGHMGEGLPAMIARFDQMFEPVRPKFLGRPISRTITDQVYVTTSGFVTEPPFRLLVDTFGIDRIMLSADYPFMPMDRTVQFLHSLGLADVDRDKIAFSNADRLLGLT